MPANSGYLIDLLPWDQIVAPGVVRHVDGALSTSAHYRGPDREASSAEQLDTMVRTTDRALRLLGDGWTIHLTLERLRAPSYPPAPSTNQVARALDEQRRRRYASRPRYVTQQSITLTWAPPAGRPEEERLEEYETRVAEIFDLLGATVSLRRLSTLELYQYLYRCLTLTPDAITPRLEDIAGAIALEAILTVGDLVAGSELRLAEQTIVPVAVAAYPAEVRRDAIGWFDDLDQPLRLTLRYIAHSRATAERLVRRQRMRWSTRLSPREILSGILRGSNRPKREDAAATAMATDADQALRDLELEDMGLGYVTLTVLTGSPEPDRARATARRVLKALRRHGYGAWIERHNALEAYLGSLPGERRSDIRRPLLTSTAVAHLAPLTTSWSGSPRHPHPALQSRPAHIVASAAAGRSPVWLSLASERLPDVQHTLIVGPTGSGKSVLLALMIAQWMRYPDARVRSLDKGASQLLLARALGGEHYSLGADARASDHRIVPLQRLDTPSDRQRALEWLLDLYEAAGQPAPQTAITRIAQALEHLRDTDRSLSSLSIKLQDHALRQALEPYTAQGPYGYLFDGSLGDDTGAAPNRHSPYQVYEMGPVLSLPQAIVTPLLVHMMAALEASLDGAPTLVAIEEVAGYLDRTFFARRFATWLNELRKAAAGVLLVIQSIDALLESTLRSAVLEGCPTRIYLPNPAATEMPTRAGYEAFGLSSRQIEIIARATPRHEYYVVTPDGSRLVTLDLSPGALRILGKAGPEAKEIARRWAAAPDQHEWLLEYLEGTDLVTVLEELRSKSFG